MILTAGSTEDLLTWTAMGTTCRALVLGPDAQRAATDARGRVARLEALWSRFRADSDVCRMNSQPGRAVRVAPETIDLVSDAVAWWEVTEGLFDPTVLPALESAGYDRDRSAGHGPITEGAPAPGCRHIEIDPMAGTVRLPAGVRIDLGGIGKGRAVDLVAAQLAERPGGLIDLGGDLRVWGMSPGEDPGWPIAIEDLRDGTDVAVLGLAEGAVATSSTLRRTWRDGSRSAHHLIDPRLGRPAGGELVTVTVVAGIAAAAEVLAKAAIVSGSVGAARELLTAHGVAALLVPARGAPVVVGTFADLCWTPPVEAL